jgi:predicted peroxiredoxin
MPTQRTSLVHAVALLVVLSFSSLAASAERDDGEKIVVHLSQFGNDLHAVSMALKLGTAMQEAGSYVTLFVDLEGVRVADSRQPQHLRWGDGAPIEELYNGFVESGAKILVCPHCAAAAGLKKESLRRGATIGTVECITETLGAATKILDY